MFLRKTFTARFNTSSAVFYGVALGCMQFGNHRATNERLNKKSKSAASAKNWRRSRPANRFRIRNSKIAAAPLNYFDKAQL